MPNGQVKTFTVTFAAYGAAGQVVMSGVQAPSKERAISVARAALHTSADQASVTISG